MYKSAEGRGGGGAETNSQKGLGNLGGLGFSQWGFKAAHSHDLEPYLARVLAFTRLRRGNARGGFAPGCPGSVERGR